MDRSPKDIVSSIDYLRKLFIMPDSPDKFVEFGEQLLEMIHQFFQKKGGIHSSISLPQLGQLFSDSFLPERPKLLRDVLGEIKENVIAHSVKVGNPYYIGHMTSAIPYFMILLEMIIAALNQNQVKIETAKASSFVEREFVAWLHRLVFQKPDKYYQKNIHNHRIALGNVTSNGTLTNLTALLVAREKALPPEPDRGFRGCRFNGIERGLRHYGYGRGVILVSSRGHYSIKKSTGILGIGEENVISVPVDHFNHVDLRKLVKIVDGLQDLKGEERTKIIAIVGIAGTTETGNVDDLDALGQIARQVGAHFHVDACWGGSALLVDEYRPLFKGIEAADTVSVDAHKLLYCPMAMGIVLFRNEKDLNYIRHSSQYVIRKNSVDTGRFTVEGSRPFACLKPWAALKIIGRNGYRLLFNHARDLTDTFKDILDHCGNFETLSIPELFILTYRFIPHPVKDQLHAWLRVLSHSDDREVVRRTERKLRKINHLVNGLNIKLHKELRRDDTTFVSRTILESTRYRPNNVVVLRAVLINPLTTHEILRSIVATQNRIGSEIWKDFHGPYLRICEELTKDDEDLVGLHFTPVSNGSSQVP